ncbi:unnamed protein product [Lampetra fluviatilis]
MFVLFTASVAACRAGRVTLAGMISSSQRCGGPLSPVLSKQFTGLLHPLALEVYGEPRLLTSGAGRGSDPQRRVARSRNVTPQLRWAAPLRRHPTDDVPTNPLSAAVDGRSNVMGAAVEPSLAEQRGRAGGCTNEQKPDSNPTEDRDSLLRHGRYEPDPRRQPIKPSVRDGCCSRGRGCQSARRERSLAPRVTHRDALPPAPTAAAATAAASYATSLCHATAMPTGRRLAFPRQQLQRNRSLYDCTTPATPTKRWGHSHSEPSGVAAPGSGGLLGELSGSRQDVRRGDGAAGRQWGGTRYRDSEPTVEGSTTILPASPIPFISRRRAPVAQRSCRIVGSVRIQRRGRLAIIDTTKNSALYQETVEENVGPSIRELKLS